ncbi:unnamed protein product [Rhizoctonia solani]|uniref:Uncharacterized protein n=1 Tax=Rhizoctonia solani TaxID=456999 RepID=A0A8H2X7Z8_9AGAM|nr:unnamed protein product [Rhizoctonia solani]
MRGELAVVARPWPMDAVRPRRHSRAFLKVQVERITETVVTSPRYTHTMYIAFHPMVRAVGTNSTDTILWTVFRLDSDRNMASVICQWFLQAIVLLLTQRLLYGNIKDDGKLKAYVLGVNTLCLLHTFLRTLLAFDYLHGDMKDRIPIAAMTLPVMITIETMLVQVYFLFRCWNIMNKRKWAIAPLIIFWVLSGAAGICFAVVTCYVPELAEIMLASWVASSLSLDITMTAITMVYLIRRRRECKGRSPVLMTIWNMLWLAAIPPMMAMIALIIIMYILNSGIWATFIYDISSTYIILSTGDFFPQARQRAFPPPSTSPTADFPNLTDESNRISGKLFVLSLLIALAGREHAANKLKQYQMEFKPLGQSSDCD